LRDYHSLYWELYGLLQQGKYSDAERLLEVKRQDMLASHGNASLYAAQMGAAYLIETERWDLAGRVFSMIGLENPHSAPGGSTGEHAAHAPGSADAVVTFAKGYAAAATGSPEAARAVTALDTIANAITDPDLRHRAKQVEIQKLELEALAASKKGDHAQAVAAARKAVALEETNSPPSGPPDVIKPPHELCGEVLLAAGRNQEAAEMFAASLAREPNRARSLLGRARAAKAMGNGHSYAEFLKVWQEADEQLPELAEAQKAEQLSR
jgi:tetratricopeptide (TPR) repeat protein